MNCSFPVYRHPSDQSPALRPFTRTLDLVRRHAEAVIGHPLNHALIQLYREGKDYISEHSDKTIDITRGTSIANVSFGAQRLMILRRKKDATQKNTVTDLQAQTHQNAHQQAQTHQQAQVPEVSVDDHNCPRPSPGPPRESQRIALPDNSMLAMGLCTNAAWLHAIHRDNRPDKAKLLEETGERISLTFRCIGTFLTADSTVSTADSTALTADGTMRIFGQGATRKMRDQAQPVVFAGHESDFDWEASYGKGFDVLHFVAKKG